MLPEVVPGVTDTTGLVTGLWEGSEDREISTTGDCDGSAGPGEFDGEGEYEAEAEDEDDGDGVLLAVGDRLGDIVGVALTDGVGERNRNRAPFCKSGGIIPVPAFNSFTLSFTNSDASRAPESRRIFSAIWCVSDVSSPRR